ncbi:DUF2631 domain-containing protein [Saccharothrix violaceirubra]|uniref:DUF2631 domain-containing protein n=1 Tax=Saccharothrix violaceirubra TaxID=413306 RepID=A0A7W7WUZ1_9PSEU|nr:DUF2631 domain-containing protein [Saccharothrix violaceirubra]MBB4963963.1 hypothetical protein [Saccharothrix violaceirubra]
MSSSSEPRPAVDTHDEPSAAWGWHGTFPKGIRIAGWLSVLATFSLLIGNHHGRTEDLYIVAFGGGMAILLIWEQVRSRTSWRRK